MKAPHQIEDSVFFCSGIGIKLTGSANYFEGVHAFTGAAERYPLGAVYVPAEGASDNTAKGEQRAGMHGNRFEHCYWDYSGIRIENPNMIEITNNYIIGLPSRQPDPAFIELVAVGGSDAISITGMRFTGNVFRSAGAEAEAGVLTAFKLNETNGQFDRQAITNSVVEGNSYQAVRGSATRVQRSLYSNWSYTGPGPWRFDLCDDMLFLNRTPTGRSAGNFSWPCARTVGCNAFKDDIFAHLQFSMRTVDEGTPFSRPPFISSVEGCVVTVSVRTNWDGGAAAVYLTADQSRDDLGCHGKGCHPGHPDGGSRYL